MSKAGAAGGGAGLGVAIVIGLILFSACVGWYKGNETPEPSPTSDRPPIIVNQP